MKREEQVRASELIYWKFREDISPYIYLDFFGRIMSRKDDSHGCSLTESTTSVFSDIVSPWATGDSTMLLPDESHHHYRITNLVWSAPWHVGDSSAC